MPSIYIIPLIKIYPVDPLVNIGDSVRGGMQSASLHSWAIFLDEKCASLLDKITDLVISSMY